jgi:hypothetical protein
MRFCGHVPNSPRNKNSKRLISYLFEKSGFFGPQKIAILVWQGQKKLFFPTLNLIILQSVRNESVRFGRHIDIEVSYKIL